MSRPDTSSKAASAENDDFHGQAASPVVSEAQPSGSVRGAEDPVLLEQVINDRLLLLVHPARDQQEQEGERARQRVQGGSLSQRSDSVQGAQVDCPPAGQIRFCGASLPAEYPHTTT